MILSVTAITSLILKSLIGLLCWIQDFISLIFFPQKSDLPVVNNNTYNYCIQNPILPIQQEIDMSIYTKPKEILNTLPKTSTKLFEYQAINNYIEQISNQNFENNQQVTENFLPIYNKYKPMTPLKPLQQAYTCKLKRGQRVPKTFIPTNLTVIYEEISY